MRAFVKLVFVVGGEDVPVSCLRGERLVDVVDVALRRSGNTGRPILDYEPRTEVGHLLAHNALVGEVPGVDEGSQLVFLSLRVGAGGSRSAPKFVEGQVSA